jgi:hypothetical protein
MQNYKLYFYLFVGVFLRDREAMDEEAPEIKNTRMDLLIPLIILAICFFLSLAVNIYQLRYRFKGNYNYTQNEY